MSLSGKLKLDELPDDRFLRNPLRRSKPDAPATKTVAAPGVRPLVSRVMPGRPFHVAKATVSDSDGDKRDSSGDDKPAPRSRRPAAAPDVQPGVGPFTLEATTNKSKLIFSAGFKDLCGSVSKQAASVVFQFDDIINSADSLDQKHKLSTFDPTRTVPISVRILGTSLGEYEPHCTLEVFDAQNKPLFSKFLQKHNSSDVAIMSGYPLYLLVKGGPNVIMYNPPTLTQDHKSYWSFNMDTLTKDVKHLELTSGQVFKLVKTNSKCAALLDFALSVKNDLVRPRLLENPKFKSSEDPEALRVPLDLYTRAVSAYRKKLASIQTNSFDLSQIKVVLKPLPLSKELGLAELANISGHVAIEITAHIPRKADLDGDVEDVEAYKSRTVVPGKPVVTSDDSDEDI